MADSTRGRRVWPRSESSPEVRPPALADRAVAEVMTAPVVSVTPSTDTGEALELAHDRRVEHLVVCRGAELAGVVCTCDLWDAIRAPVASVMSAPAVAIDASATLGEAVELVRSTGVGFLPVIDRGAVVGVLTRGDLGRLGLIDHEDRTCASCGSHHHVRRLAGYEHAFCVLCLDAVPPAASYDELGWGD